MKRHAAFTMIELIFVIVIMGIIGKFGVEFLAKAYQSFIFAKINNELQSKSETAVETIAARLQYRIKDSVIARTSKTTNPIAIADATGSNYKVLEWVGIAQESRRGLSLKANGTPYLPDWSGIINLNAGNKNILVSPQTDTTNINTMIADLSDRNTTIDGAALYFVGANSNVNGYGWSGALANQQGAMHPIKRVAGKANAFTSSNGVDFSGVDVYEYYLLAWTAYAIVYEPGTDNKGTLRLYYDYRPWNGEKMTDGKNSILMTDVSTFQFMSIGSIIKIQVCTKSDLAEEYSLCKEKTIF